MTIKELAIKHQYFCSRSNFFATGCCHHHKTFDDFFTVFGDEDPDGFNIEDNYCFRFDIKLIDEKKPVRGYEMEIFMMLQRKGVFCSQVIDWVGDEDVPKILRYLQANWDYINNIWQPINKL